PFFHEVGGSHDNHRTSRTANRHTVGDGQGHEGFTHADFVGENHAGLFAKPTQNLHHLSSLPPLIHRRHLLAKPCSQHQIRRQPVNVAHSWHRFTTRFQKPIASAEI